jgi:predicted DNA-binding transcriptional regulator AlpA
VQFISWRQLAARASVSLSTLKRMRDEDPENFPHKISIFHSRVGFDEAEADRWLAKIVKRSVPAS